MEDQILRKSSSPIDIDFLRNFIIYCLGKFFAGIENNDINNINDKVTDCLLQVKNMVYIGHGG